MGGRGGSGGEEMRVNDDGLGGEAVGFVCGWVVVDWEVDGSCDDGTAVIR